MDATISDGDCFGMNVDWLDDQLMTMSSWLLWSVALPVLVLAGSALALRQFGYLSRSARRAAQAASCPPVPERPERLGCTVPIHVAGQDPRRGPARQGGQPPHDCRGDGPLCYPRPVPVPGTGPLVRVAE